MVPIAFVTGENFNLLPRARIRAFLAGLDDVSWPLTNAWDGRVCKPARFTPDGFTLVMDMTHILNGGLEGWDGGTTVPNDWTVDDNGGTGSVDQTAVAGEFHSGIFAAQLTGGDMGVSISQSFTVRPDEVRRFSSWLKCDTIGDIITVEVFNPKTGRYLNSSMQWVAAQSFAVTHTGTTTYTPKAFTYTVENLYRCGSETPTLTVTIAVGAGDTAFVDDVGDWPKVDLVGFFGLACMDSAVIAWQVSDDGASFTDTIFAGDADDGFEADQKPNLYMTREQVIPSQWHQIQIGSVGATELEIGELVMCQVTELGRMRDWGMEIRLLEADIANKTLTGELQVYGLARWPRHALQMRFNFPETSAGAALADMREARDYLWGRARGRRHNILIVPDTDQNLVMLMRGTEEWAVRKLFAVYGENEVALSELPFVSSAS